ncbi:MAG: ABC transporter permease, partial [Firmicutes bacterium]|nr:ABC transporter permease [Bacillota bacterium]
SGEVSKTSTLIVTDDEHISNAIVMKESMSDEETIPYPETGEAVVNNKMAEMLGVEVGDEIIVEYDDTHHDTLKISGIYRNYVNSYLFINAETYESVTVNDYEPSIMYLTMAEGSDVHQVADKISDSEDIVAISVNEDVKVGIDEMMQSLNYIIILVILCAGALAFIVLFNLSNINLTERVREIATIEVLGFYPRETGAYVFRENLILVILGIIAGLPTGMALHRFIMKQIQVDMVSFENVIEPLSYIYTVITVLVFTFIVDRVMRLKLKKINMAEALKSIE